MANAEKDGKTKRGPRGKARSSGTKRRSATEGTSLSASPPRGKRRRKTVYGPTVADVQDKFKKLRAGPENGVDSSAKYTVGGGGERQPYIWSVACTLSGTVHQRPLASTAGDGDCHLGLLGRCLLHTAAHVPSGTYVRDPLAGAAGIRSLHLPAEDRAARREPCCRSTCGARLASRRAIAPAPCLWPRPSCRSGAPQCRPA
jgi:hypothetical protein